MTYAEKLRDPRWQRKRLEIMNRDGWKCRQCGVTEKTLNVHHINYENGKMPWEYADANVITVCEPCHTYLEQVIRSMRRILATCPSDKLADIGLLSGCISGLYTKQAELRNGLSDVVVVAVLFLEMQKLLQEGESIPLVKRKEYHAFIQSAVGQFEAALANAEFYAEASQS